MRCCRRGRRCPGSRDRWAVLEASCRRRGAGRYRYRGGSRRDGSHLRRRGVGGAAGGRGRPGRVWSCCDGACSASPVAGPTRGWRCRWGPSWAAWRRSMAVPEVISGWPSWVLTSSLWTVCSRVSSLSVRVWAGGSRGAGTAGRCRGGAPDSPAGPGRGPDRCHARVRGAVRSGRKVCSP